MVGGCTQVMRVLQPQGELQHTQPLQGHGGRGETPHSCSAAAAAACQSAAGLACCGHTIGGAEAGALPLPVALPLPWQAGRRRWQHRGAQQAGAGGRTLGGTAAQGSMRGAGAAGRKRIRATHLCQLYRVLHLNLRGGDGRSAVGGVGWGVQWGGRRWGGSVNGTVTAPRTRKKEQVCVASAGPQATDCKPSKARRKAGSWLRRRSPWSQAPPHPPTTKNAKEGRKAESKQETTCHWA